MTAADAEALIAREKPAYDGAEPSGTSVALLNALRLHTFTTDDRWRAIADRAFASVAGAAMNQNPLALTEALLALDWAARRAARDRDRLAARAPAPRPPARCSTSCAAPSCPSHALAAAADVDAATFAKLVPFIADKVAIDGRPTAYVCTRGRCDLPVHDPAALAARLAPQGARK